MIRVVGFIPVPLPVPDVVQLLEAYAQVWEGCDISSPKSYEMIEVHPDGGQRTLTAVGMLVTVGES